MVDADRHHRHVRSVDIAEAAGVAQATVSRVMNGGSVSAATRRRVVEVMEELGYAPSAVARGLVTSRTNLIGVVVGDVTNPFYPELLSAVGRELRSTNLRMMLQDTTVSTEKEAVRLLMEQRVDGMIFTTALQTSDTVRTLAAQGMPVVLANRVLDAECDSVAADNVAGAAAAASHLADLGHRRIAVIEGHPDASTSVERSRGFRHELDSRGIGLAETMCEAGGFDYTQASQAATRLLAMDPAPTAVFCHNDLMAFATLNVASGLGLTVPTDLSVVGFDDIPMAGWDRLDLTSVRQPTPQMTQSAVAMLRERIDDPEREPRRVLFPSELVVRGSTGPAPGGVVTPHEAGSPTGTRSTDDDE